MAQYEINGGISPKRISDFFNRCREAGQEVRTLIVEQHGKVLARVAAQPYDCTDLRMNYSVTKTITSLAIGILITEGKLSLEDRLYDFFPEHFPRDGQEDTKLIRVYDLLTMQTGHETDSAGKVYSEEDSVAAFFRHPMVYKPGTVFRYDTGASCMLACMAEKAAGMPFFDFVSQRLFFPMGIRSAREDRTRDGFARGGTGLYICADDMLKIGELLLARGNWKGKQLVGADYIANASKLHAVTDGIWENLDSRTGYGFQVWMNSAGGFRADGSQGQYIFVFPEKDAVAVVLSQSEEVQVVMDGLYDLVSHLGEGEDETAPAPAYEPFEKTPLEVEQGIYVLQDNPWELSCVSLAVEEDRLAMTFSDGVKLFTFDAGRGNWTTVCTTVLRLFNEPYTAAKDAPLPMLQSVCCKGFRDGVLLYLRYRSIPERDYWYLTAKDGELNLSHYNIYSECTDSVILKGKRL